MSVTVLLVDDQPLMRDGLRLILESTPDITVVGEADDGAGAASLVAELDPDLVLMDIRMSRIDGLEATRQIVRSGHRARVLILTTYDLDEHLYDAVRAGACGFLLKTAPTPQLLATIRAAAAGDTVLAPEITRRLLDRFAESHGARSPEATDILKRLSERELEVLTLVARGRTNDEIASELFVSLATVKSHVHSLFRKLEARDRVHAVIIAYEAGLAQAGDPPR
jgi:DNA-binding NarL/FixJ family response regulator